MNSQLKQFGDAYYRGVLIWAGNVLDVEAVRKLREKGLVREAAGGYLALTDKGLEAYNAIR